MERKTVFWGIVIIAIFLLMGAIGGCSCGKKEALPEEKQEDTSNLPQITEDSSKETPEISETSENPQTTQTTPQTPKKSSPTPTQKSPRQNPPQPSITTPRTEWEYVLLLEEEKEFNFLFTQWKKTGLKNINLPNDVLRQEIEITAIFTLYTPSYYSPKINQEGIMIPLPVEATFESPNKINFQEPAGYYGGEDCVKVSIKDTSVIVETASGPKIIDTTKGIGWDTAGVTKESWPQTILLPSPVNDARNIEAVAVIPQHTTIEVPAKLLIPESIPGTESEYETYIIYPAYPEKKISGKLVVTGEIKK